MIALKRLKTQRFGFQIWISLHSHSLSKIFVSRCSSAPKWGKRELGKKPGSGGKRHQQVKKREK